MNKLFLSLLFSFSCCLACKSQTNHDAIPTGTITAYIDGVPASFNIAAIAGLPKRTNGYVIRGLKSTSKDADIIAIGVESRNQPIGAGSYEWGNSSYTASIQLVQRGKNVSGYASTKATIAITVIQNGSIQGTFTGVLKGSSGPDIKITNGKFNVKIESK